MLGDELRQRVPLRLRRRAGRSSRRATSLPTMWNGSVANQGGYHLNLNNALIAVVERGRLGDAVGARCLPPHRSRTRSTGRRDRTASTSADSFSQFDLWMDNQQIVPELRFDVRAGRSGGGDVHRGELPGRVDDQHRQCPAALRDPDRPRQRGSRHRATQRGQRGSTSSSASAAARAAAQVGLLVAGLLAHAPELSRSTSVSATTCSSRSWR